MYVEGTLYLLRVLAGRCGERCVWALRETMLCATWGERISTLVRICLLVEAAHTLRQAPNFIVIVRG